MYRPPPPINSPPLGRRYRCYCCFLLSFHEATLFTTPLLVSTVNLLRDISRCVSPLRSEQIVTIWYLCSYISLIALLRPALCFLRLRKEGVAHRLQREIFSLSSFPFFSSPPPLVSSSRNFASFRVNAKSLLFFFPPPLLLFFFLFFFFLYPRTIEKPTTDAHCEHRPPFGFSPPPPPPSLPLSFSPEVCSGASEPPDGRGGSKKEREKRREIQRAGRSYSLKSGDSFGRLRR